MPPRLRPIGVLLAAVAVLGAAACGKGRVIGPPPEPVSRDTYQIGVTDLLQIRVWNNRELDVKVPVRSDGMISMPLLDDIPADGLTPEELKEVVTERLSAFVTAPDVTIIVLQTNSKSATIMGGIGRARSFPLNRDMRVLEAIASAGGFSTWAKKDDVRILRKTDDGLVEYRFDYDDYLKGRAPDSNILLQPGDTIVVPD